MKEFKTFCKHLAEESGKVIRNYFRTDINIESKSDESPVTIADKKAEEVMREMIMKEFPEHGIIGEEFGNYNDNAEFTWILDPIDGTRSFILGTPLFGTLISLTQNSKPIIGLINQAILGELLIGDNKITELNENQVKVRECDSIKDAFILTSDHLLVSQYQNGDKYNELLKKSKLYRGFGDCFGYYLVATGFADIMVDPIMSIWDLSALIPVINGAGGKITDWQGKDPVSGTSSIATAGTIHNEVIKILN